ncbi:unnamed protein product [Arctia plantaginis]|uniref:Uncharacterized protein n=1 Tax=Arctia plantaginis TaxID=874455 RepID=A0A8S0YR68_ARCPL|nr:unnamed protein product [Arctia plantaginis]
MSFSRLGIEDSGWCGVCGYRAVSRAAHIEAAAPRSDLASTVSGRLARAPPTLIKTFPHWDRSACLYAPRTDNNDSGPLRDFVTRVLLDDLIGESRCLRPRRLHHWSTHEHWYEVSHDSKFNFLFLYSMLP